MARTKEEIKIEMDNIYNSCMRVYGTTKDGSMMACLVGNDYYKLKEELKELGGEKENE
jgi:hypothetical protein